LEVSGADAGGVVGDARQPTPNASFQARIIGGDAAGKYSRLA
jgi:hypothetical protein